MRIVRASLVSLAVVLLLAPAGCRRRGSGPVPPPVPPPPPPPEQLVATGAGQALTRITSDPMDELRPALSPDASALLFVGITYKVINGQLTSDIAQQVIVGVNPSGGTSRTIYTSTRSLAGSPSWMPDGSGFVFVSNGMGQWNVVRSLSKSPNAAVSIVTRGDMAPSIDHPVVSPDGKRVTFQMVVSGTRYVGVSGIDGSSFTQLTEGFWPSWSPDGKQIVFAREVGQYQQVFLVNAATGDGLVQVTNDEVQNTNPSFSPDGRFIVFQSNRGWNKFPSGAPDRTWNLFAVKPDGTQITQLTDGAHDAGQPFWGSDGNIYFASNDAGNYDVWRIQAGGELGLEEAPEPAAEPTEEAAPSGKPAKQK